VPAARWNPSEAPPFTVTRLLLLLAGEDRPGLRFLDRSWTWRQHVDESARWAGWLASRRDPARPFHVGVLLDNVPEFSFILGAAALGGAVIVGINPTRHGAELARDIAHTDCQFLVTEQKYLEQLETAGIEWEPDRFNVIDHPATATALDGAEPLAELVIPDEGDLFMLIFTSGRSGKTGIPA